MRAYRSALMLAALASALQSCQTAIDRTAAKSYTDIPAERAKAEAAQCRQGSERLRYVLKALAAAPDLTRLRLPPNRAGMELGQMLGPIDADNGLALDLCVNGDNTTTLSRIVYLQVGQ